MQLASRLTELVRACFTGIWIESHEHQDATAEIGQLCRQEGWRLAAWDIECGLHIPGQPAPAAGDAGGQDPLAAIRAVNALAAADGSALLLLQNFHRFLQSPEIVQALIHQITAGKQNRTFIVILSPVVAIPTELEKLFLVIEHQLPDREQLHQIACGIATEDNELPTGPELDTVLDAAAGLTRYEAEAAFSLSLVHRRRVCLRGAESGRVRPKDVGSRHRRQFRRPPSPAVNHLLYSSSSTHTAPRCRATPAKSAGL